MTTMTEIPGRPEQWATLRPTANKVTPERWSVTSFESPTGERFEKHQQLTLGRKPPFRCKWFLIEETP